MKVGKGVNIKAVLPKMEDGESISAIIDFKDFDETESILMATKYGVVKQVKLNDFINARKNGIKAIILDEGDALIKCLFVKQGDEAMIVSKNGKGLRFSVDDVRIMGRATHGVRGMNLADGDEIVGLVKVEPDKNIILVTNTGKGKQVEFDFFRTHGRGTMGQLIYKLSDDMYLVSVQGVNDDNDVVCITKKGQTIRTHVNGISSQGRNAGGVNVFKMKTDDDYIVAMAVTNYQEDEPEITENPETDNNSDVSEVGTNENEQISVSSDNENE